jgi:2,4-dienoyl-CoA reductase-like NADH-dependent reductase (Old Yellow Enzyme family)
MSEADLPTVFRPASLGPLELRNRVIKAATFEGMAPGGLVSDRLVEYHRRPAAGGVGMSTLAYCSVAPEGRTYRDQIWMRPEALAGLRALTDAVHEEGAAASVQLGHAGYFANPKATGEKGIAPSRVFSTYGMSFPHAMKQADFDRLTRCYRDGAELAIEAGFDAIEIHMGHGYLLSQFLSPFTNRRDDEWGGSIDNRARFPRLVAREVHDQVNGRAAVYAKLNMADGFRAGLQLDDGVRVAQMLDDDGSLDAIQLTGGFTSKTPMFLMRGDVPLAEMIELEPDRVRRMGLRLFSKKALKAWPFEEAFFLERARRFRDAVDLPLMLLGGITRRDTMIAAIDTEGFDFVAMARALLREPDLVRRYADSSASESACVPCNKCITEMDRRGTRCVFVPESMVPVSPQSAIVDRAPSN